MSVLVIVAIGWIYVVLMMAVAEATAANGNLLGAVFTFVLYGVLPLSIVLYLLATPARRRALAKRAPSAPDPDHADHAAGESIASERKEP
jgi:membrane protein implicated in regulation of membrane protease activity